MTEPSIERRDVGMTVRDVLIAARELVADPAHWSQAPGRGPTARDADDKPVQPGDQSAVRWCGYGAVIAQIPEESHTDGRLAACARLLDQSCPGGKFPDWEWTASHAATLAAFDRAIAAATETTERTPS